MRANAKMTDETAAPVTFRPKSPAARALLEAVAAHQNLSLSKFVAQAAEDFARLYVQKAGGPEKFAADLEAIRDRERRTNERWLAEVLAEGDAKGSVPDIDSEASAGQGLFTPTTNNR